MAGAGLDPVEAGFVESLAQPGGNITGFTNLAGDLGGKRLELLKEAVPKSPALPCFIGPIPRHARVKEVLPAAARALGVDVSTSGGRAADDFERYSLR